MSGKKRIAVIFGGQSSEHEVSRVSAQSVVENIDRDKYDVVMIGITRDGRWLNYDGPVEKLGTGEWQLIAESQASARKRLAQAGDADADGAAGARAILKISGAEAENRKIDVVFPVLHGCNGEDGTIQGLFELAGIPYVGSGVLGSALGMDKAYAKIIFEKEGLPQGIYLVFDRKRIRLETDRIADEVESVLAYPCFVKPSNAGSSVGVSKVYDRDGLKEALRLAAEYDRRVLVEEFIDGREIECSVLGNDRPVASTVGEVIPCNEFYDYDAKYAAESTSRVVIPAELPEETIQEIREYAVRAFKSLDCAGLSRVDFFVHRKTGRVYINEINTMPGFTSISMYAKLWEASGVSYPELVQRLIELAVERHEDNRREISR
jgi:D-alanine-D-alanine ligase